MVKKVVPSKFVKYLGIYIDMFICYCMFAFDSLSKLHSSILTIACPLYTPMVIPKAKDLIILKISEQELFYNKKH